jgi:PTH1 family peptidyl-tRNA hydrolase
MWWRKKPEQPAERVVAGLGNPGGRYAATRHNVGFEVVAALGERHGIALRGSRMRAASGVGEIGGVEVALIQPQTYMNLSGRCVAPAAKRHGVQLDGLLVATT